MAATFLLFTGASCDRDVRFTAPLHRFVEDPVERTAEIATIEDDTRQALGAPPVVGLLSGTLPVPATGILRLGAKLPEPLREAKRLLLLTTARIEGVWTTLPSFVVPVDVQNAGPGVRFDLPIPGAPTGASVLVNIRAIDVSGATEREHRSPPVPVPANSRLELATGVLGSPSAGRATFVVDACLGEQCRTVFRREFDVSRAEERRWKDATVDLAEVAGPEVVLVFRDESIADDGSPAGFSVWGNPRVVGERVATRRPPNVILVSLDTLSARHLPLHGYEHDTAPFLSELSKSGSVFEHCTAAATHTLEAHMTMMTGLAPAEHGIHVPGQVLDSRVPTLAEHLRRQGYATAAFTENGWVGVDFGFHRGFDVFRENRSADLMVPQGYIEKTFDEGMAWLEGAGDRPFFLFLHSYQVHDPYVPPAAYAGFFRPEGTRGLLGYEAEEVRYDQEIRFADDQVRKLWTRVKDLGHGEDTILLITSDHGEAFFEHGWLRHGSFLHEEVVHVPWLVLGPGVAIGRRIAGTVGHSDLFPTIAELVGAPLTEGVRGMSLAPMLANPDLASPLLDRVVVSETWSKVAFGSGMQKVPFGAPAFAAVQGNRKLSRYPQLDGTVLYEYFDLEKDPGETVNLWPKQQTEVENLRLLLDRWEEDGLDAQRRRKETPGSRGPDEKPADGDPDPAREEKLRALGYLN